jgi:hypothetical protein
VKNSECPKGFRATKGEKKKKKRENEVARFEVFTAVT